MSVSFLEDISVSGNVSLSKANPTLSITDTNTSSSSYAILAMTGRGTMSSYTRYLRVDANGNFSFATGASTSSNHADVTFGRFSSLVNSSSGNQILITSENSSGPSTGAIKMKFEADQDSQLGQYNEVAIRIDEITGTNQKTNKRGRITLEAGGIDIMQAQTEVFDSFIATVSRAIFPARTDFTGNHLNTCAVFTGGKVGIGITSPQAGLHVSHNSNSTTAFKVAGSSDTDDVWFQITPNSSTIFVLGDEEQSSGGGYIKLDSNANITFNEADVGINTSSPSEKLDVNGTVKANNYKGYVPHYQSGGFYHSSSSSSSTIYWLPTNYISEVTSSNYYNNWVAPYDGRVRKIIMRYASGTTPTATSVAFRWAKNGSTQLSSYSATVTSGASTSMRAVYTFSDTNITFSEGDRIMLGFTTNGGTRRLYGFAYTVVFEYNKN